MDLHGAITRNIHQTVYYMNKSMQNQRLITSWRITITSGYASPPKSLILFRFIPSSQHSDE